MLFWPLIRCPCRYQLDTWALFPISMIYATSPCYYYEYRNHIPASLSACVLTLKNYSGEEINVQESKWSGGHDWIDWYMVCPGSIGNFKQQHELQIPCINLHPTGTGNEQGNITPIWRTSRGEHDRQMLKFHCFWIKEVRYRINQHKQFEGWRKTHSPSWRGVQAH